MTILKDALEKFSRGKSFKRRFPASVGGGPVWVTPEAGLRYWFRSLSQSDPDLLQAAREFVRRGDTVWDIGANMGLFAFAAAGRAGSKGRVLAVEADTHMVALLRRSARLKWPRAAVEVLPAAVDAEMGIARFHIANRARASNSLQGYGSTQMGGVRESQLVAGVTLNWILERWLLEPHCQPPNVLKIDVEGAELAVLQGASRLLAEARPLILCEVFERNTQAVTEILKAHSYILLDMGTHKNSRSPLENAVWNTIACPHERYDEFQNL